MNSILDRCLRVTGVIVLSSCASTPEPDSRPAGEAAETAEPATTAGKAKTLVFETEIAAPVEKVWEIMLSPEGYAQWTAPFHVGSHFEGSWSEGERIHFLAPGGSGMVAIIDKNRRHEFISIRHIGFVVNGVEDTTSEAVQDWAPAFENYRFASVPGGTRLTVELEVLADWEEFMIDTWPTALAALESLCEAD